MRGTQNFINAFWTVTVNHCMALNASFCSTLIFSSNDTQTLLDWPRSSRQSDAHGARSEEDMKDGLQVLSSTSAKAIPLLFYEQKAWGFHIWCLLSKDKIIIVLKSISPKGYSIKMFVGYPRPSFPGRHLPTSLHLISFCRSLSGPLCPLMPDCSLFLTITHTHTHTAVSYLHALPSFFTPTCLTYQGPSNSSGNNKLKYGIHVASFLPLTILSNCVDIFADLHIYFLCLDCEPRLRDVITSFGTRHS